MSIILFSRPVRTGKTTELSAWCGKQKNIAGILMPDSDGGRKAVDLSTNEIFNIECKGRDGKKEELIQVGKFYFYAPVFKKINNLLLNPLLPHPRWLVIDEVGILELAGAGFYDAVIKLVEVYNNPAGADLLLVVRENLCNEVIAFFKIKNYSIVHNLKSL